MKIDLILGSSWLFPSINFQFRTKTFLSIFLGWLECPEVERSKLHRQKWPFADRQNWQNSCKTIDFAFWRGNGGKFQAIVDIADSHDLEARSFIYTEIEKKTELVAGVLGEGERGASKKPALC